MAGSKRMFGGAPATPDSDILPPDDPKPAEPIQPQPKTGSVTSTIICARCKGANGLPLAFSATLQPCDASGGATSNLVGTTGFHLCADCANVVLHVVGLERRVRVKP